MEDGSPISGIIVILLLILLNSIVTCTKVAFENVNASSIKKKSDPLDQRTAVLIRILEKPKGFMNAIEFLIGMIGFVVGIIFAVQLSPSIEEVIRGSSMKDHIAILKPCYYIMLTVVINFIVTLFGTMIPKAFAVKYADELSYQLAGFIRFIRFAFGPVAWLLDKTMYVILLMIRVKPDTLEDNVTEEEIMFMVNEGQVQGVFDADEAEMISNIIELDDKEAQDIMTHKKKIVAVNADMTVEEALHFMLSENYSRYPLYQDNHDNIIGILHLKDVINAYISEELKNKPLADIAREPYFVPDTQNINILFHDMQSKNIHMAIVIDEYGQTAGLVALEDFLEEIVGNIQDEYDEEEKMILSKDEHSVVVKGAISLEELEDDLNILLAHEDFDTLNGLLISLLDRIPGDGENFTLHYQDYDFDILATSNRMIEQVRITKAAQDHSNIPDTMANG